MLASVAGQFPMDALRTLWCRVAASAALRLACCCPSWNFAVGCSTGGGGCDDSSENGSDWRCDEGLSYVSAESTAGFDYSLLPPRLAALTGDVKQVFATHQNSTHLSLHSLQNFVSHLSVKTLCLAVNQAIIIVPPNTSQHHKKKVNMQKFYTEKCQFIVLSSSFIIFMM